MARRKRADPDPEFQAAYFRALETAEACAAALFGEPTGEGPEEEDASPRAEIMVMGMIYFLVRLDPADLRALSREGGFAAANWRPLPSDRAAVEDAPFAGCLAAS